MVRAPQAREGSRRLARGRSEFDGGADRRGEILRRLDRVPDIRRQLLPPPTNGPTGANSDRASWRGSARGAVRGGSGGAATRVGSFALADHAEETRRRLCDAAEEISELHQKAASSLCAALLAGAVSRFNRAPAETTPNALRGNPKSGVRMLSAPCGRGGRAPPSLGSGGPVRGYLQARDLAMVAESHIEEGARHAAASANHRRATPGSDHSLARRLGDCLRQLLPGVALGTVAGHAARGAI